MGGCGAARSERRANEEIKELYEHLGRGQDHLRDWKCESSHPGNDNADRLVRYRLVCDAYVRRPPAAVLDRKHCHQVLRRSGRPGMGYDAEKL